jgi:2,5-diamino-6-(ribosylamino)-4(3H)-pyrimidinone 5'-phosphate reductase
VRPYTILYTTESLDGMIADPKGYSRLSCLEDFILQHYHRAWADAVMVGSRTAMIDNPRLTLRLAPGRSPLRVVVDSGLQVPLDSRLFSIPSRVIVLTTEDAPSDKARELEEKGVILIRSGRRRVDLTRALTILAEKYGVRRLMVEGGGRLNCALVRAGLLDEIHVTIAPVVLGGGTRIFHGDGCPATLGLKKVRTICGGWVHLEYVIVKEGWESYQRMPL